MVRRLLLLLLGGLALAGCKPIALDALGFQCTVDTDCDSRTTCIGKVCRLPWPGQDNTGVPSGTTLKPSGPLVLDTPNAGLDGLDIQGCVQVKASGVTLKRSRITCDDYFAVTLDDGVKGLVLEDVEITGAAQYAITGNGGYTLRRGNVHGITQPLEMGDDTTVEDSWIHDLGSGGIRAISSGGGTHILFKHNLVDSTGGPGACVGIGSGDRPLADVHFEDCFFDGGGYTVDIAKTTHEVSDLHLTNNRFGRHHGYDALSLDNCTADLSGNVYDDTGEPIQ